MLQTSYKDRLPRGWSFPVAAKDLSEWLEGVEGAARHPLRFSESLIRNSSHRRSRKEDVPYSILRIDYSRPLYKPYLELLAAQGQDDQWEVWVGPVPSEHRAKVHNCVVVEGLPRIRKWLEQTRSMGAGQGRGFCSLLYQERSQKILFEYKQGGFGEVISTVLPCLAAPEDSG